MLFFIHIDANATWKSEYNTVSFDANGGQGNILPIYNKGHIRLKGNLFTNEGYHFVGWNTLPDGTGIHYSNEQTVSLTDNLVLYAQLAEREPVIINEYVIDDDLVINAVDVNTQVSDFIEHFDLLDGYTVESETKTIKIIVTRANGLFESNKVIMVTKESFNIGTHIIALVIGLAIGFGLGLITKKKTLQ